MDKPKLTLTHAKHDPSHCLAPGLFRSLQKGERKTSKLDVIYEFGNGQKMEFSGPEPLGADDLRVLQGLVAMAGPSGLVLSPDPMTAEGTQLRLFMEPQWDAIRLDALVVKGSYRSLAAEIGYANIEDSKPIRESIERLWKVSIIVQQGTKRMGFRLLSEYASDDLSGHLHVALNPKIAAAIMGDAPHARIELSEVRSLKTDAARLIHQRLCGWIDQGKTGKASIDTLVDYVYPEKVGPGKESTHRMRIAKIREALTELTNCGWTVNKYMTTGRVRLDSEINSNAKKTETYEIGRPAGKRI